MKINFFINIVNTIFISLNKTDMKKIINIKLIKIGDGKELYFANCDTSKLFCKLLNSNNEELTSENLDIIEQLGYKVSYL